MGGDVRFWVGSMGDGWGLLLLVGLKEEDEIQE